MRVWKYGDVFVIGRDFYSRESQAFTGQAQKMMAVENEPRSVLDSDGMQFVRHRRSPMTFSDEAAAEAYLESNRATLRRLA